MILAKIVLRYTVIMLVLSSFLPGAVLAKEPTTVVYKSLANKKSSFLVLSNGNLSERKEIEDAVEKKLSDYKVLKSYMVIPPSTGKLSAEDLKSVSDRMEIESIDTILIVQRTAIQGDTRCMTNGQATSSDYGIPELGQHVTSSASTMCQTDQEWAYQITLKEIGLNSVASVSEYKSQDLSYGDQIAIEVGGKLASKMVDRMIKSLLKNKAF
jgi:hypothetical protein